MSSRVVALPLLRTATGQSVREIAASTEADTQVIVLYKTISHRQTTNSSGGGLKKDKKADEISDIDVHRLPAQEVFLRYGTDPKLGLEPPALARFVATGIKNSLSPPKSNTFVKILGYLFGGFNALMWLAMILTFISYEPLGLDNPAIFNLGLAFLLLFVILISAAFYAYVDFSASQVMKAISSLVAEEALVTRSGEKVLIQARDLCVGDVVSLSLGDRVPGDMYLIQVSSDLKFDRSLLTGESDPVSGTTTLTDQNPLETKNLALSSTFVVQGSCTGVCFAIGDRTVVGRIVALSSKQKESTTNLQRELMAFTLRIGAVAILAFVVAIVFWAAYVRQAYPGFATTSVAIVNSIGTLTAFVPQGLPVCVALALSVVARRMAARKVLVKNLASVETIGSMSILCSDKTGTLTQGKMHVEQVASLDREHRSGEALLMQKGGAHVLLGCYLCNDAVFESANDFNIPLSQRAVRGNSTDVAAFKFAALSLDLPKVDADWKRVYSIPFNSKNKYMLIVARQESTGKCILFMKGGPDVILGFCTQVRSLDTTLAPLDGNAIVELNNYQSKWSSQGQRVIMLCSKELNYNELPLADDKAMEKVVISHVRDLEVNALIGIRDPPREDVPPAIKIMRTAGVRVFMVTGDFSTTAQAIARQIGIITAAEVSDVSTLKDPKYAHWSNKPVSEMKPDLSMAARAIVLTGTDVTIMTQVMWDVLFSEFAEIVFARTTPEQKMTIVEEAKVRGDSVVGVTGDGVNDAPALKAADIGLAMGAGSDVAKEAANCVLLNNDFASIPVGIENGRLVFDNLRKVCLYVMLTGSYVELMAVIANVFFGLQPTLSSYYQVAFCIFNDVVMSISLMFEQPESDLMNRKPRNTRTEHLTDLKFFAQIYLFQGLFSWLSCFGIYFYYWHTVGFAFYDVVLVWDRWADGYKGYGIDDLTNFSATAQSVFFVAMTIIQFGNILAVRNRRVSILESNPFSGPRQNWSLFLSMFVHLSVTLITIFGGSNAGDANIFAIGPVPTIFWFLPIPFAVGVLLLDEIRKAVNRAYPTSLCARMAW